MRRGDRNNRATSGEPDPHEDNKDRAAVRDYASILASAQLQHSHVVIRFARCLTL